MWEGQFEEFSKKSIRIARAGEVVVSCTIVEQHILKKF